MPYDMKNQEGMFPFFYDTRYEPGQNEDSGSGLGPLEDRAQAIAREMLGIPLSKSNMTLLDAHLETKGLNLRHPGDMELENEIRSFIKKVSFSKKVIQAYARLQ